MPLRLDISMQCAVKEIELLHETLVKGMAERDTATNERMSMELSETVNNLNLQIQCVCYEPTCRYWEHNACRCSGNQRCLGLGYLIRPSRVEVDEEEETEMTMAETALTENDKARRPDEPFIVWKVRVANRLYSMARQIHNTPDRGTTRWRYENWRTAETHNTRTHNFEMFIARVRALPPEERMPTGMDVSQVVGCSICNVVFENLGYLEAHVDRKRFNHMLHDNAEAITDTTHERVRDTAPDYRPPIPTFVGSDPDRDYITRPISDTARPPSETHNGDMIDRIYREEEEDDEQYRDRLQDYVRSEYRTRREPDAVGCGYCGRIFKNGFDYFGHATSFHNFDDESARENLIK